LNRAEVVLLNKIDVLTPKELTQLKRSIDRNTLPISALEKTNIAAAARRLWKKLEETKKAGYVSL
jgi:50S ribosomal subunit-associated GTPase HflX